MPRLFGNRTASAGLGQLAMIITGRPGASGLAQAG